MNYVSEYADEVKAAIDDVVSFTGIKNCNALARRLGVSKQALSKWRQTGIVPAHRAMQMELMTDGSVSWRDLCPDIVVDFDNSSDVIYETSRQG